MAPTRAQTSGHGLQSSRALAATALTRCVLCAVDGPRDRVADHLAADHADPRPTSGFMVSIAPHLRATVAQLSQRAGLSMGAIISAAVDQHLARLSR